MGWKLYDFSFPRAESVVGKNENTSVAEVNSYFQQLNERHAQ
ncbi:hypothetical protein D1BOALGB6SA_9311 [Olavius sp. associated proteobacterium Delta 1]|nr:hypothetical protein D1BOALGB6SA_9311 [Olavius sp. associated proteobacterium Delta 1]